MILHSKLIPLCFCLLVLFACNSAKEKHSGMAADSSSINNIQFKTAFQKNIDRKNTDLFILRNKNHVEAAFTNYGARILSFQIPDKSGNLTDVVVGFGSIEAYQQSTERYFGATIGRYGNRIANGKFKLDSREYSISINNSPNALHGGKKGFQDVVWDAKQLNEQTLEFTYLSKDMEEGFPGNLQVKVIYSLSDDNELIINYEASTDKKTILNLTNHAFFNLNGEGSGTILNHTLKINAEQYTPVDSTLIPLGEIVALAGSPFDFRKAVRIGERINDDNIQLKYGKGYDHNYVLNPGKNGEMKAAATVRGDKSGIVMEVYTQEPGLQFYSGNFMKSKNTFKGGTNDDFRTAFCLETQHFPDSPNQPNFPSTILKPGELYKTKTIYKFSSDK
jgi:aldose 1-epimerase